VLPDRRVRLGRGDVFGEMAFLTGRRRSSDVVALSYCQLLVLRAGDFKRFLKRHPDARTRIVEIIRKRRRENLDRAKEGMSNRR
jgi:monovalent cation:H+ antiporter, CPA1 family